MKGRLGQITGIVVFVVAAALLTSVFGVVVSPVTLIVLLLVVAAHPSLPFIATGTVIGALTGLEGGFLLGYFAFGQFSALTTVTLAVGTVVGATAVLVVGVLARRRLFEGSGFDLAEPALA